MTVITVIHDLLVMTVITRRKKPGHVPRSAVAWRTATSLTAGLALVPILLPNAASRDCNPFYQV